MKISKTIVIEVRITISLLKLRIALLAAPIIVLTFAFPLGLESTAYTRLYQL